MQQKLKKSLLIIALLNYVIFSNAALAAPFAKVTIKVVNEEGEPVENANIITCFNSGCTYKEATTGKTDRSGVYTISKSSSDGRIGGEVTSAGYYLSTFHHDFYVSNLGMWQPWNKSLTVQLRAKLHPVSMYVRNCWLTIPIVGEDIGFDLMVSDWVIPYGRGLRPDFTFKIDRQYKDVDNFDVKLTVAGSGEFDGLQPIKEDMGGYFNVGSRFRLPRTAPEIGYRQKLVKRFARGGREYVNDVSEDNNYFFRVRSEKDVNGHLVRAMYGKIKGDIEIEPRASGTAKIHLFYYLNPDYTRNLEFDPAQNLLRTLPKGELPVGLP